MNIAETSCISKNWNMSSFCVALIHVWRESTLSFNQSRDINIVHYILEQVQGKMKYAKDMIPGNWGNVETRKSVPVVTSFSVEFWKTFCKMDQIKSNEKKALFFFFGSKLKKLKPSHPTLKINFTSQFTIQKLDTASYMLWREIWLILTDFLDKFKTLQIMNSTWP